MEIAGTDSQKVPPPPFRAEAPHDFLHLFLEAAGSIPERTEDTLHDVHVNRVADDDLVSCNGVDAGRKRRGGHEQLADFTVEADAVVIVQMPVEPDAEAQGGREEILVFFRRIVHIAELVPDIGDAQASHQCPCLGVLEAEILIVVQADVCGSGKAGTGIHVLHVLPQSQVGVDETPGHGDGEHIDQFAGVTHVKGKFVGFVVCARVVRVFGGEADCPHREIEQGEGDGAAVVFEFERPGQIGQGHVRHQVYQPRAVGKAEAEVVFHVRVFGCIVVLGVQVDSGGYADVPHPGGTGVRRQRQERDGSGNGIGGSAKDSLYIVASNDLGFQAGLQGKQHG